MPIFGNSEIEALRFQVKQLSERLESSNTSLEKSNRELTTLQSTHANTRAELRTRNEELLLVKAERDTALNSLKEFEKSLRSSLKQLGTMLEIENGRWIDPAAVWHVYVQSPYSYQDKGGDTVQVTLHTLFLNSEAVLQGSGPVVLGKARAILEAKAKV